MKAKEQSVSLLPILSVNFVGMLGYSIVLPFLVFLVQEYGGNEFVYGVLGSIYPAFQFFGAPLIGRWSDKYGRKRILLLSQIGTFLAWILFLIALFSPVNQLLSVDSGMLGVFSITLPLLILFVARALDGITGGNISVANAYLSDISDDSNRKKNFGKMAMSTSLGFILGPMIAGLLGSTQYNELLPVLMALVISGFCIFLIKNNLPESKVSLVDPKIDKASIGQTFVADQKECYKMKNCEESEHGSVFSIPNVPFIVGLYFLIFLGFSFYYASFPMYASKELSWSAFELGMYFSLVSGLMIFVQGPLLNFLSNKVKDTVLIILGSLILAPCFLVMTTGSNMLIYLAAILFAVGNGIMWPSFMAILAKVGGEKQQGLVQGVSNSSGSLASIFGLILGGYFYGILGSSLFLTTSLLMIVIAVASIRMFKFA